MPEDEMTQKEAWELAWWREYDYAPDSGQGPGFKAGYLAAKSEQEATVLAAKRKAWEEGYDAALADIGQKCGERFELLDAEMVESPYSDEPTKEPK